MGGSVHPQKLGVRNWWFWFGTLTPWNPTWIPTIPTKLPKIWKDLTFFWKPSFVVFMAIYGNWNFLGWKIIPYMYLLEPKAQTQMEISLIQRMDLVIANHARLFQCIMFDNWNTPGQLYLILVGTFGIYLAKISLIPWNRGFPLLNHHLE